MKPIHPRGNFCCSPPEFRLMLPLLDDSDAEGRLVAWAPCSENRASQRDTTRRKPCHQPRLEKRASLRLATVRRTCRRRAAASASTVPPPRRRGMQQHEARARPTTPDGRGPKKTCSAAGCSTQRPNRKKSILNPKLVEVWRNEPRTLNPCRLYPKLYDPGLNRTPYLFGSPGKG
jgi:hypothetical protein